MKRSALFITAFLSIELFGAAVLTTATVNYSAIDLYRYPAQEAARKPAYLPRATVIPLYACDRYGWCRTDAGYVKRHLLLLKESIGMREDLRLESHAKAIPLAERRSITVKPASTEVIDVQLPDIARPSAKTPTAATQPKEQNLSETDTTAYSDYFMPKSAKMPLKGAQ